MKVVAKESLFARGEFITIAKATLVVEKGVVSKLGVGAKEKLETGFSRRRMLYRKLATDEDEGLLKEGEKKEKKQPGERGRPIVEPLITRT